MFFKMAIKNVKRSFKDYTIYFLTLTFAVCIFYSFNSINAQTTVLKIGKSSLSYMKTLINLISLASIFISFILGGLIVYANNFIVKRRKKELGIYMTLGMGKSKISKILLYETFIIGILSLVVGLILGIIVSQGLSVVTAKLFALNMNGFKFIISFSAIGKTIMYFGIAFIIVMIFNQIIISKYKLIDMLNASKKNENIKVKNPVTSVSIFLLSVLILGFAYNQVIKVGLFPTDPKFMLSVILGMLGTLLFFYSLAGFFIHMVQRNKKIYLKNLNIFILRQVNNNIKTNFISMAAICLMLFVTIVCLFTMFSYKANLDKTLKGNNLFDASATMNISDDVQKTQTIKDVLKKLDFKFSDSEKHVFFNEYQINLQVGDLLNKYINQNNINNLEKKSDDGNISVIRVSDYNAIIRLSNQQKTTLKNNELLVASNYGDKIQSMNKFMQNEHTIKINNKPYIIKNKDIIKQNIENRVSNLDFFYLVVPDDLSEVLTLSATKIDIKFGDKNSNESEKKFATLFDNFNIGKYDKEKLGNTYGFTGFTKEQTNAGVYGNSAVIVFLGLYVGIVVLISSAAVLAIQQLSEASVSLERYKTLKKIGVTDKIINKTIFVQTLICFIFPFVLAVIHSIVGIILTNNAFETHNKSVIASSSLMISLIIVIIYGGYFYTTYVGYKNIVKNS
ncbi:ABC transporter permease [Clostridium sp.]